MENGAALSIPAKLSDDQMRQAQKIARDVFEALECEGMARVDLFLDKNSGQYYFNEINTLPGSVAHYLWSASSPSLTYTELLTAMIEEAEAKRQHVAEAIKVGHAWRGKNARRLGDGLVGPRHFTGIDIHRHQFAGSPITFEMLFNAFSKHCQNFVISP